MVSAKAQGLSMNFVVVLAIALIVMVIVIGIFAGRTNEGNQNLRSCEARNGVCVVGSCPGDPVNPDATSTPLIGGTCYNNQDDVDDGQTCCLRKTDDD